MVIEDLVARRLIIRGGTGVSISLYRLADAVAEADGMDTISTVWIDSREPGFTANFVEVNLKSIRREMKLAREVAPQGTIGSNITTVTKHYDMWVKEVAKTGADIIISGARLPVSSSEYMEAAYAKMEKKPDHRIKLAPVVSSARSAMIICKTWDRRCHIALDLVVVGGPLVRDHLGFSLGQLFTYGADTSDTPAACDREAYNQEVEVVIRIVEEYGTRYGRHIPVVTAGGIYAHEDVMHQLELGTDGIQVAIKFVTTQEYDASDAYKRAYINAEKEDIVITQSPVGISGRAILNPFLGQIKGGTRLAIKSCFQYSGHCDIRTIPYCITMALVYTTEGDTDYGLLSCGSNAYCAGEINAVDNAIEELARELA